MAPAFTYRIGGRRFSTKDALRAEIRRRLASYEDLVPFSTDDDLFFRDLLTHHPLAALKVGCGVDGFYVVQNPVYTHQRCLFLRRTDGSTTDWSWRECLSPTPHHQKVRRACRALLEPQMMDLKRRFFDAAGGAASCPLTGDLMTFTTAHVDHIFPQTFEALFLDFVRQEGIDPTSVPLRAEGDDHTYQDVFDDDTLAARWLTYHDRHARLRVISARANMNEAKRKIDS